MIVEADLYKDSDSDGLSDYHEKKIAAGEMCIGTGQSMKACSYMNYLSADSDGDGIEDGDEIEIKENSEGNYYGFLNSNPCLIDSDSDGYEDFVEDYIGMPLMSKFNLASGSHNVLGKIYYKDWMELLEEHSWNYIHNSVQEHIVMKYSDINKEYVLPDKRRIDLIRKVTLHIWEVKPSSYLYEPKCSAGVEQLERYKTAVFGAQIGDIYIEDDSFEVGKYEIEYMNLQNGLIVYSFKRKKKQEQEEYETETKKEEGYVYTPQIEAEDNKTWDVILAIIVLGGTVAEDVATGGFGLTNDIPSFIYAYELIFGH